MGYVYLFTSETFAMIKDSLMQLLQLIFLGCEHILIAPNWVCAKLRLPGKYFLSTEYSLEYRSYYSAQPYQSTSLTYGSIFDGHVILSRDVGHFLRDEQYRDLRSNIVTRLLQRRLTNVKTAR